jgi:hypothetical protein
VPIQHSPAEAAFLRYSWKPESLMITPVGRHARADRALCPNRIIPAAGIWCNSLGEVARRTGRLAETVGGLTRLSGASRRPNLIGVLHSVGQEFTELRVGC